MIVMAIVAMTQVIALWGDHGWQLGEHSEWCKHTNFDVSLGKASFVFFFVKLLHKMVTHPPVPIL